MHISRSNTHLKCCVNGTTFPLTNMVLDSHIFLEIFTSGTVVCSWTSLLLENMTLSLFLYIIWWNTDEKRWRYKKNFSRAKTKQKFTSCNYQSYQLWKWYPYFLDCFDMYSITMESISLKERWTRITPGACSTKGLCPRLFGVWEVVLYFTNTPWLFFFFRSRRSMFSLLISEIANPYIHCCV